MARVNYLKRSDSTNQAIFDRLERERKVPTANVFLAMTQAPDLLDGFLTYANALRGSWLKAVQHFGDSPLFNAQEKAVMAFARESTQKVDVSDAAWNAVAAFLSEPELIALTLTVGWYNSGVRLMGALAIELEPGYAVP